METRIEGMQDLCFTNDSGETIKGMNLFVSFVDENIVGRRTEKFFVKESLCVPVKVGQNIDLSFNHRGKLTSITVVEK